MGHACPYCGEGLVETIAPYEGHHPDVWRYVCWLECGNAACGDYCAEGYGATAEEAVDNALEELEEG